MIETGEDLLKTIDSPGFDLLSCVNYLRLHSSEIGVHYYLAKKLRSYQYDEVEFLIPQLLQLLVSFETNSVALEEFLLDYCERYPHFSLIVFWNLQAYVFELKDNPNSYSFQIVRNLVNKLQDILFNPNAIGPNAGDFRENLHPSLVLCGALAASIGLPKIHLYTKPLIQTQGKQQKSFVFKLANFQKTLTRNLTLKNQKLSGESRVTHSDDESHNIQKATPGVRERHSESSARLRRYSSQNLASDDSEFNSSDEDSDLPSVRRHKSSSLKPSVGASESVALIQNIEERMTVSSVLNKKRVSPKTRVEQLHQISHSMPDLNQVSSAEEFDGVFDSEISLAKLPRMKSFSGERQMPTSRENTAQVDSQKWLKVNYSKNVTEFILALQNISLRLSQLPKEARLSALRAELSIVNDTLLPAEIDIPQLLPVTSTRNKYHKLLKLSVNEACVLNSAERVPFLMFVEFLSDEIDFNPASEHNQLLLKNKETNLSSKVSKLKSAHGTTLKTQVLDREETQNESKVILQVETDLSDLKVFSQRNSTYDLTSLKTNNSHMDVLDKDYAKPSSLTDLSAKNRADQMRIAAVMLQQLESSGKATSEQSASIKNRIVESMIALQDQFESIDYEKFNQLKGNDPNAGERKLENDFKLAEDWQAKKQRIRNSSIYGHLPNWDLCSVIAKNGSDLPQEAFACQLISMISNIWTKKKIPSWTKRMKILITSANTGLVETITNAISIHSIKKSLTEISIVEGENSKGRIFTLRDYFEKLFGGPGSLTYKRAQEKFARSLASYSVICYVLQIKDRHNGNIMLDNEGHIIHIDFGFLLSNSPGSVGFEAAPFKLTTEYVELLGGIDSDLFVHFKELCKKCFIALREESDQVINMVEIMQKDSSLPCFNNGENTSVLLKQRLQLQLSEDEANEFVEYTMIGKSLGSMYTRLYDQFQLITQGIYS